MACAAQCRNSAGIAIFFDFDVKEPDKALLNALASIFGSEGAHSGAVMP